MYTSKPIERVPFSKGAQPPKPVRGNGDPTGVIKPLESPRVQPLKKGGKRGK